MKFHLGAVISSVAALGAQASAVPHSTVDALAADLAKLRR